MWSLFEGWENMSFRSRGLFQRKRVRTNERPLRSTLPASFPPPLFHPHTHYWTRPAACHIWTRFSTGTNFNSTQRKKKKQNKTLQAFLRAARPSGWTRASLLIVSKRFSKSTWRLRVSPSELFHMSIGKQSWFLGTFIHSVAGVRAAALHFHTAVSFLFLDSTRTPHFHVMFFMMRKSAGVREVSEVRLWTWSSLSQAKKKREKERKIYEKFEFLDFILFF